MYKLFLFLCLAETELWGNVIWSEWTEKDFAWVYYHQLEPDFCFESGFHYVAMVDLAFAM